VDGKHRFLLGRARPTPAQQRFLHRQELGFEKSLPKAGWAASAAAGASTTSA